MFDKARQWFFGGPIKRTFAEEALVMSDAHAMFTKSAAILEKEIADKRADIAAAHARLEALNVKPPAA